MLSSSYLPSLKWPREGLLRRTYPGAWKLNGKTYRTRGLALAAARRQGLWVVGDWQGAAQAACFANPPYSWTGISPYCEPRGVVAFARSRTIVVPADLLTRPGAPVYLRTSGDQVGAFTGSPSEDAVRVEGFRVESVSHNYETASEVRSLARIVDVSQDPEPAS